MLETKKNIELRSEEVQEILTAVPNWMIRWGNTLVFVFILGLLTISWFVKYPDVIVSKAIITTKLPPQKEYSNTSGKIDAILIEDNQTVFIDTPLAIIENTANYQDVFFLKSIIDTIQVNNKYFNFPIDELPVLFLGTIDSDFALFENSYLEYKLNKELRPYSNEAIANSITSSELRIRLSSLQSQKRINQSELAFQKSDLERYQGLYNKGVISLQDYELKQASYLQAERSFTNIDASISQLREAMSNANKTSKGTKINNTKVEISLLKNVLQSYNQLKRALKNWEMKYLFSAKIDGTVSFLNTWKNNTSINQGDLIFTIIPKNNEGFIAKLKTPARNSGKIKIGQTVNIKLENYPDEEFGVLKGFIESISLIPDSDGFYLIDVSLSHKLITSYDKEIVFRQEMSGAAEIITEDLRLIERFFYRLRGIFSN